MIDKDLQDSLDAIRMKLTAAIDEGRSVFLLLEHAQSPARARLQKLIHPRFPCA